MNQVAVRAQQVTTQVTREWRQWIAENLVLDADPRSIVETLIGSGFSAAEAQLEVKTAVESPYLAGAQRLRNRLAKRNWVLDCQRRMNRLRPAEVPRVHKLSADAFLNDFYTTGRPVILTGLIDAWPAMHKWNLDYFRQLPTSGPVEVQFGRTADEQYELNSNHHKRVMAFSEYVELIAGARHSNDFYMTANNGNRNREALSALWNDFQAIPGYLDPAMEGQGFFWFGPAGTVTPFHHDLTNNIMAQVIGRKRLLLAPACEIDGMANHLHCHTEIDGRNLDHTRFPALRDVRMLECTIAPGDVLFLPVGCWHFVEGLDMSVTMTFTNFAWDNTFTERYPALQEF